MRFTSIKNAQSNNKKCITWPKKFGKGRQKWNKECMDARIDPRKLHTPINTMLVFLCKLNFYFNFLKYFL
jgi:hypothetical protein